MHLTEMTSSKPCEVPNHSRFLALGMIALSCAFNQPSNRRWQEIPVTDSGSDNFARPIERGSECLYKPCISTLLVIKMGDPAFRTTA